MEEKTLDRSSLLPGDKKLLEDAIKKNPSELTSEEIGIIRARRSYLTSIEREVFKPILEESLGAGKEIEYGSMTKAQLLEVCEQKGIPVDPTLKKTDIISLIEESEK